MENLPSRQPSKPTAWSRLLHRLEVLAAEKPHHLTFYIFLIAAAIVVGISLPFWIYDTADFFQEVMAEAHGVVLDILIIGWLLFYLRKLGERRTITKRYHEEIDDYLGWRAPEATLRIAGNIRRLNRLGVPGPLKLTEAYLVEARLDNADLTEADLWGSDLSRATLRNAVLTDAVLAGAILRGANLERAIVGGVDLRGADLTEADLEHAFLEKADLRGANLTACDLQFAALPGANLAHTRLFGANLRGAHLERANLRHAMFEGANLQGASLDGADLRDADFTRAHLQRTDFTGAILPEGDELITLFDDARTLHGAKLPEDARRILEERCAHLFQPVVS